MLHFRSVTEIAPKSLLLCLNRSSIQYGFSAGVRAIWKKGYLASLYLMKVAYLRFQSND